ncbi:MAG: GWxTD domain-containing protein [bacterium]
MKEKLRNPLLLVLACIAILAMPAGAFSQETNQSSFELFRTPQSPDVPRFDVEFFNLASDIPGQSRGLFRLSFANDELQFIRTRKKKFQADYEAKVIAFDTSGTEIDFSKTKGSVIAKKFDETNSLEIKHSTYVSLDIPPGLYKFRIELKDMETARSGYREGRMSLRQFPRDEVTISDVFLLDSLDVEEATKIAEEPVQQKTPYAFFEVYNVTAPDSLDIAYEILGPDAKVVKRGQDRVDPEGGPIRYYINLADLAYVGRKQHVKITVDSNGTTMEFEKPLSLTDSDPGPSYADLDKAIEQLVYIAKKDELKRMKALEGDEKIKAFDAFWNPRDPDPSTRVNEYKEEYYRRIWYANKRFATYGRDDGWKTDMGLIYVKLGPPDYVQTDYDTYRTSVRDELNNFRNRPYIVWTYTGLQKQVIFEYKITDYRIYNYTDIYDVLNGEMVW